MIIKILDLRIIIFDLMNLNKPTNKDKNNSIFINTNSSTSIESDHQGLMVS